MTVPQRWRKSSYSGQESACVELPGSLDAIRDSKNGDVLRLSRLQVTALLAIAKQQ
ncbi:MAG: DUF397 domain-containing protein [Sciscionella sp.]